jgi:integrase
MPSKQRPVKRLIKETERGSGQAQIVEKPGQLAHILWAASRGDLGKRNVVVCWMLFGSGLRINEVAHLKVSDVIYRDGTIKEVFTLPAPYTKTGKSRACFIIAKQQRKAIQEWIAQRVSENAFLSKDGTYGGLQGDSYFILGKRGKTWRRLAFNDKKYRTADGRTVSTKVCGSLENLVRALFTGAGLNAGSSHSGRRTLASWLDRKGYDLEFIQMILGHENPDMSLEYIDPHLPRIKSAFESIWKGVRPPKEPLS